MFVWLKRSITLAGVHLKRALPEAHLWQAATILQGSGTMKFNDASTHGDPLWLASGRMPFCATSGGPKWTFATSVPLCVKP